MSMNLFPPSNRAISSKLKYVHVPNITNISEMNSQYNEEDWKINGILSLFF